MRTGGKAKSASRGLGARSGAGGETRPPSKTRERPATRPVTAAYLRKAALHYISGRAASVAMVRQTLERRAKRRLDVRALEAATAALIEAAIAELLALSLLDDAKFAEIRTGTLAHKGLSRSRIAQGLRAKGVAKETVAQAVTDDIDELAQARRFVERKRLGARRRGGVTPASRKKDLGALARAGFGFGIAAKALSEADGE